MMVGTGAGARSGPGHLIGAAHLTANDSRRVPCPQCGAARVAKCVRRDGQYAVNSHQERKDAMRAAVAAGEKP